ncbi:NAD(P)H-dependent oxidoreductase [Volucribacter amazonae]|uniref:NAD(P)H-dependent oxidoreductase n=1 Tax=Volucribacter amazonae TaxID=256731 RepID=A0A9X4PDG0_9PAST|nr:NAD(P)H-dependent oxidoreductase [Volucribacter amazonae]MDG6896272.1 NAD(P)H-dependent oxidoreductase [Volucribacter amazonae]
MINKQDILKAYHYRHACKAYDPNKKVSREDMDFILETARLSPSSFGFEPWRFLVIENPAIKQLLHDNAWGLKEKINDCSHVVIILARKQASLLADSDYITHMMKDVHHLPDDIIALRREFYRQYADNEANLVGNERAYYDWASKQTYIALGNMLTSAAMIGIDSTPVEGFPYDKVNDLLVEQGLYNGDEFRISVMALFGYRLHQPREKTRQATADVIEWVE